VVSFPDASSASISIAGYVPATSAFLMSDGAKSDLGGKAVSVLIENDNSDSSRPSDGTLSLTEVHKIYQALNAAAPASILIDSATLDPLYKGSDWIRKHPSSSTVVTLYASYPSETTLMRGIKVRRDGSNLYFIEYDRPLVVEDIVYDDGYGTMIRGLGLYKEGSGSAVPATGDWADVIISGCEYVEGVGRGGRGLANESTAYLDHLAEAGLKYTGVSTPAPTHNMNMDNTDLNLFSNGLYDFLKLHKDNNLIGRLDNLNFNQSKLDGQVYESLADRRLADGHYNPAFTGNVEVYMVNLIRGKIGATTEFSNINILGDGKDLTNRDDLHFANVSMVGDYHTGVNLLTGHFYGNLDIEGDFPLGLTNNTSSPSGYLTAWEASGNTRMNNFAVFHVKPTDPAEVKRFGNSNSGYGGSLKDFQAIVFENKASISNLGDSMLDFNFPHAYKVVRDSGDGSLKFTDSTSDFVLANYDSDTTKDVPSLDPDAWRVAGNSKTNPATTTWGALDSSKKWNWIDFDNLISMVRDTGIRLADAVLSRLSGRSMGG
jgi:hypothetical protein